MYPYHQADNAVNVYFQTIMGDFDENLKWPMENVRITSSIIGKDGEVKKEYDWILTYGHQYLRKPPHSHSQYGYSAIQLDNEVQENTSKDVLTIRIKTRHL